MFVVLKEIDSTLWKTSTAFVSQCKKLHFKSVSINKRNFSQIVFVAINLQSYKNITVQKTSLILLIVKVEALFYAKYHLKAQSSCEMLKLLEECGLQGDRKSAVNGNISGL